jgi:two-component sensor histidine kinase
MQAWVQEVTEHWLPRFRRNPVWGWTAGLGIFLTAFLMRQVLASVLPSGLPFITFFIAIMLASLVGGARVGVTVVSLCVLASWYFFLPPHYSFAISSSNIWALIIFAVFGAGIVAVTHELNLTVDRLLDERKRSARAEEALARLNRELMHRIRNIFALASSMAHQTSRHVATPVEMTSALTKRFRAMAIAQELLVANNLAGADLGQLADDVLSPLAPSSNRLNLAGPPLLLTPATTTSICLVLHELGTNAVKHGAWSNNLGTVDVNWSVAADDGSSPVVTLRWRENNGPPCHSPGKVGLGTLLIDNAVAGASVDREFLPEGLSCTVRFAQPNGRGVPDRDADAQVSSRQCPSATAA